MKQNLKIFILSVTILILHLNKAFCQNKTGKVVQNAVEIDADYLGCFNHGAAIILKGKSTSLINSKGEVLIPYGKYYLMYLSEGYFGGFPINYESSGKLSNNLLAIIDYQGKEIFTKKELAEYDLDRFGNECLNFSDVKTAHKNNGEFSKYLILPTLKTVDVNKNKRVVTHYYTPEGLAFKSIITLNSPNGYPVKVSDYDSKKGKNVSTYFLPKGDRIGGEFDIAYDFIDGYAIVGNNDIYGEKKYGVIDTLGKEIVPIKYSNIPLYKGCGVFQVSPKEVIDIDYIFINNKGKIIFEHKRNTAMKDLNRFDQSNFIEGYCMSVYKDFVIDTSGTIISMKKFLGLKLISSNPYEQYSRFAIYNYLSPNYHSYNSGMILIEQGERIGYFNTKTQKLISSNFVNTSTNYLSKPCLIFDKFSQIAYAEISNSPNKNNLTEGYIDSNGEFIIIKKKAIESKW